MTPDPALVATAPVHPQTPKPRWHRWGIALALVSPVAFAVFNEFPLCPTAGVLGIPCPGCGLTRATLLLLNGEFARALALHPLVVPLAPMYIGALVFFGVDLVRGPRNTAPSASWLTRRWVSVFGVLVLTATVTLWVLRFVGYFGGPVPVQTYRSWAAAHAHP